MAPLPQVESSPLTLRARYEKQARAACEAYWEDPPEESQRRLTMSRDLLSSLSPKRVIDIGCGRALFSPKEAQVTVVDLSAKALSLCDPTFEKIQGCFPYIHLPEGLFDCVIAADLIAELPQELHRLALSELAALLTIEGSIFLSTPLDTKTINPLESFRSLVQTEFVIEEEMLIRRFRFFTPTHVMLIANKRALASDRAACFSSENACASQR